MPSKNKPGCNCCGCDTFTDTFDRANSTDIGADWTEVAGDWSIVSASRLRVSTTNAIALLENTTVSDVNAHVLAPVRASADSLARIYLNYTDANNNYYAEFRIEAAGLGYLRIYSRSGGVSTLRDDISPITAGLNADWEFSACITRESIFVARVARAGVGSFVAAEFGLAATESRYALGTGGTVGGNVDFSSFRVADVNRVGLVSGTDCQFCIPCGCCDPPYNGGIGDPMQFRVTYSGTEYILDYDPTTDGLGCRWYGGAGGLELILIIIGSSGTCSAMRIDTTGPTGRYELDNFGSCEGPVTLPRVSGSGPATVDVEVV